MGLDINRRPVRTPRFARGDRQLKADDLNQIAENVRQLSNGVRPGQQTNRFPVESGAGNIAVRAASHANLTLTGLLTVDGVVVAADQLVLVMAQDDPSENGIYIVKAGAWKLDDYPNYGQLVVAYDGICHKNAQYTMDPTSVSVKFDQCAPTFLRCQKQVLDTLSNSGLFYAGIDLLLKRQQGSSEAPGVYRWLGSTSYEFVSAPDYIYDQESSVLLQFWRVDPLVRTDAGTGYSYVPNYAALR